jgi:hypothetical protein
MADSTAQSEVSIQTIAPTPYITGARKPETDLSPFLTQQFLIKQILATVAGSTLVQIVSVTNAGGVTPVGTVDVTPLVNMIDGSGKSYPHGTVHGLPYARTQNSGGDAVILDPKVGDIGIAVFADRDISGVKATGARSNPGSRRQNDMSDGVYLFSCHGGTPTQYIQFSEDGITLVSPKTIKLQAKDIELDATDGIKLSAPQIALNGQITQVGFEGGSGSVSMQGPVNVTNDVVAEGTSVHTHTHTNAGGHGNSGPPA